MLPEVRKITTMYSRDVKNALVFSQSETRSFFHEYCYISNTV